MTWYAQRVWSDLVSRMSLDIWWVVGKGTLKRDRGGVPWKGREGKHGGKMKKVTDETGEGAEQWS